MLQTAVLGHTRLITRVRISDIIKCMKGKYSFTIQSDLNLERQRMTIKCVASIYTAYYKTVEVTVGLRKRSKHRRRQHEERGATTEASTRGPGGGQHTGN